MPNKKKVIGKARTRANSLKRSGTMTNAGQKRALKNIQDSMPVGLLKKTPSSKEIIKMYEREMKRKLLKRKSKTAVSDSLPVPGSLGRNLK